MTRRFRLPFAPALLLALAAGCGGGGSNSPGSGFSSGLPKSVTASGLTVKLTEDRSTVGVGGDVNFTLTLTNTSGAPITYMASVGCYNALEAIDGISSTVTITNTKNATSLQLPDPGVLCNAIGEPVAVTLAAGASVTGTVSSGNEFIEAGQYEVTASVANISSADGSAPALTIGTLIVTAE